MTLADRLELAILEHGPMAECHLATTVRKQRQEVTVVLRSEPRFVHNGLKARASRWDVRRREYANVTDTSDVDTVFFPPDFDRAEDALVKLVHQGREHPEDALLAAVCVMSEGLGEPVVDAPLVLPQENPAELCEPIGRRLVERTQDRLAVDDGQRQHLRLDEQRVLELMGDVVRANRSKEFDELAHVVIGDRKACELHRLEAIRTCVRRPLP
jgi:hypothetical protein